jgi:hypothetical protein
MMISDSEIRLVGDPLEVSRAYLSENFSRVSGAERIRGSEEKIRLIDAWIANDRGQRVDVVAHGSTMRVHLVLEALDRIDAPAISMWVSNEDEIRVFAAGALENGDSLAPFETGERVEFSIECENRLATGRHYIGCSVTEGSAGLQLLLHQDRVADLVSYGLDIAGIVAIDHASTFTRLGTGELVR